MVAPKRSGKRTAKSRLACGSNTIQMIISFAVGCCLCSSFFIIFKHDSHPQAISVSKNKVEKRFHEKLDESGGTRNILAGKSILVGIASYDFSQIPHLEEVLDGFRDVCETGAKVDVFIYTTIPYPISLIDLLNTRLRCTTPENFSITISLHSPALRLHLVDVHRPLFYEKIEKYDLFVYTEDDIRIRPTTLAAYLQETDRVIDTVGLKDSSNYNVGVVRYEYNYPPDVIIDDKSRHATRNVTRVYWEHVAKPVETNAILKIENKKLKNNYISMGNHHQGMFIATRYLLQEWKRDGCNFDVVRNRPGAKNNPSQPSEGTQRVWMSSQMLYGSRHCNVLQLLPMDNFGALNVLHLPNKNYRRVGKKGRIGGDASSAVNEFGDGTEEFVGPDPSLLTAMEFHSKVNTFFNVPKRKQEKYDGIMMIDEIEMMHFKGKEDHMKLVRKRLNQFDAYVARGGVLLESDFEKGNSI